MTGVAASRARRRAEAITWRLDAWRDEHCQPVETVNATWMRQCLALLLAGQAGRTSGSAPWGQQGVGREGLAAVVAELVRAVVFGHASQWRLVDMSARSRGGFRESISEIVLVFEDASGAAAGCVLWMPENGHPWTAQQVVQQAWLGWWVCAVSLEELAFAERLPGPWGVVVPPYQPHAMRVALLESPSLRTPEVCGLLELAADPAFAALKGRELRAEAWAPRVAGRAVDDARAFLRSARDHHMRNGSRWPGGLAWLPSVV